MSVQVNPLPVNPGLHVHWYAFFKLKQLALGLHGLEAHSSKSTQERPLPVNPAVHLQMNDPTVSVQVALAWHGGGIC